jgi:hypothetical protein
VPAFYACLTLGAIPITVVPPRDRGQAVQWLPAIENIAGAAQARFLFTCDKVAKTLRSCSKDFASRGGLTGFVALGCVLSCCVLPFFRSTLHSFYSFFSILLGRRDALE